MRNGLWAVGTALLIVPVMQTVISQQLALVYLAVLVGIIARTLVPFLLFVAEHPGEAFDKKYLAPAIIAVVLNVLAAPTWFSDVNENTGLVLAYLVGWGSTDFMRDIIKLGATRLGFLEPLV